MTTKGLISIICPSKNSGQYITAMIESIQRQTYKNWELIIVDAQSNDGTLEVLKKYPEVKLHVKKELPYIPSLEFGFKHARGEYIMQCSASDGYLNPNWFQSCVNDLNNDISLSLVWGLPQTLLNDNTPSFVSYHDFFHSPPPNGKDFFDKWIHEEKWFHFPEGNFCIRKNVLFDCWPDFDIYKPFKELEKEFWLTLNLNIHKKGYLSKFIPVVANFARIHPDSCRFSDGINVLLKKWEDQYYSECKHFKNSIVQNQNTHYFRNGLGNIILQPYSYQNADKKSLFSVAKNFIKPIIPPALISVQKKILANIKN